MEELEVINGVMSEDEKNRQRLGLHKVKMNFMYEERHKDGRKRGESSEKMLQKAIESTMEDDRPISDIIPLLITVFAYAILCAIT